MRKLLAASCISAVAAVGAAAPTYANPNPHNNSCQTIEVTGGTPGNAATSPGSVFNEGGINSPMGGTGGQAYNAAQLNNKVGAASQYDTACASVTSAGTGTPKQSSPTTTQITNNSVATRPISHTGNGPK